MASAPPPAAAPPLARDPWAWATLLAIVPLALRVLGSPLAEPVAEDFDFLYRALLEGMGTLLDGGGSLAFWRPIPHQLYYALLGPLLVTHPALVGALHLALLALGALLLYRALRPAWSGGLAAAAASFPLLAESTRTIAGWPTQFVDLGLFLFVALALHEATRRRLVTALAALLAALLCKEVAVVAAVMLPLWPAGPRGRPERLRWALASVAAVVAWGLVYVAVRRAAHLELPHGIERDPAVLATPWLARATWALGGSLRAFASLPLVPLGHDLIVAIVAAGLVLAALAWCAVRSSARERLSRAWPWMAWGLLWFLLASATLTAIFPLWQPNRSQFGSVGLGIALVALLGAAHPSLAGAMVVARLALLGLAPAPAPSISTVPPQSGAFMDYARLTRLQRFMRETRTVLRSRHPTLPAGAVVVQQNLPHGLEYALGGDKALRVWYRDRSLGWVRYEDFRREPSRTAAAILQFQPRQAPAVAIVEPEASRLQLEAEAHLHGGRYAEMLVALDRADSAQRDTTAVVFRVLAASWRGYALTQLGRAGEGERPARAAVALDAGDVNARFVLAGVLEAQARLDEADAQLDTLLALSPGDRDALEMRARINERRAEQAR